tara:strand:+ start:16949 stop:18370 length:1422 start_codon:yes stop_codon:yes gene_type:complete
MIFSSTLFLLYFLPIFLVIYHLVPKILKNYTLLGASIFFYAWGAPKFIFVIIGSTLIDFYIVKAIHKSELEKKRKILLLLSLFLNLGLLAYFKYANFFVENLNSSLQLMGFKSVAWTSVILPIGISFYTFQTLTYSIDIYRRIHKPLIKVTDYMLYILSFPQMIAGPIVRYKTIAAQLINREEKIDDKLMGFYRFSIGLAKKVLIANVMAEQADLVFDSELSSLDTTSAWIGMIAYTFQIYFDFSGYSDMAIGLGKILGFKFPENFDAPYISQSISEFWRRWHITLGSFMKNYLYIPLGGNRSKSKRRVFFNLWLVFLLSGLWHGAEWNFIIWGAYHGLFLIMDRIFLLKLLKSTGRIPSVVFTFLVVMIGWVIFRLEKLADIKSYLLTLFSFDFRTEIALNEEFMFVIGFAIFFSFIGFFQFGRKAQNFLYNREVFKLSTHFFAVLISFLLMFSSISWLVSSDFNPFIYFRF